MAEKMTWSQITKQYPNCWVAMTDVTRSGIDIISAIVQKSSQKPDDEEMLQGALNGQYEIEYTTPDGKGLTTGILTVK